MSYKIISKFIKDISFEIPNAQTFVLIEKEISKYNLMFDIKYLQRFIRLCMKLLFIYFLRLE